MYKRWRFPRNVRITTDYGMSFTFLFLKQCRSGGAIATQQIETFVPTAEGGFGAYSLYVSYDRAFTLDDISTSVTSNVSEKDFAICHSPANTGVVELDTWNAYSTMLGGAIRGICKNNFTEVVEVMVSTSFILKGLIISTSSLTLHLDCGGVPTTLSPMLPSNAFSVGLQVPHSNVYSSDISSSSCYNHITTSGMVSFYERFNQRNIAKEGFLSFWTSYDNLFALGGPQASFGYVCVFCCVFSCRVVHYLDLVCVSLFQELLLATVLH